MDCPAPAAIASFPSAPAPQRYRLVRQPVQGALLAQCPHCSSHKVEGHGSIPRKDGTRQRRQLCRACHRTFNENTGTPLNYLKKRQQWAQLPQAMAQGLSVRRTAALLRVRVATAFRWRHRLLSALDAAPQPALTGPVAAGEAYVPYSEKGSRNSTGPGAYGRRTFKGIRTSGKKTFRRFVDGKPSCVLLVSSEEQQVAVIAGQGRPGSEDLQACLRPVLGVGAELWAEGLAPYAEACRQIGVPCREGAALPCGGGSSLCRRFLGWMRRFCGVATRYLANYLCWYRHGRRIATAPIPRACGQTDKVG